jgi:hypothetical protein
MLLLFLLVLIWKPKIINPIRTINHQTVPKRCSILLQEFEDYIVCIFKYHNYKTKDHEKSVRVRTRDRSLSNHALEDKAFLRRRQCNIKNI